MAEETEAGVARTWSLHHLAATAALSPGDEATRAKAARLIGYVDAQLAAQGSHRTTPEQREYDRVCAALNATLGGAEFTRLMKAGGSLTHERAISLGRSL